MKRACAGLMIAIIWCANAFATDAKAPAWATGTDAPGLKLDVLITQDDARKAIGLAGIVKVPVNTGAGWTGAVNFAYPDPDTRALLITSFNERRINEKNMYDKFCGKVGKSPKYQAVAGIGDVACLHTGPLKDLNLYFRKGDYTLALVSPSVPSKTRPVDGPAPLTPERLKAVARLLVQKIAPSSK